MAIKSTLLISIAISLLCLVFNGSVSMALTRVAKIPEIVATLEETYYSARDDEKINTNLSFFQSFTIDWNVISKSDTILVDGAGGPLEGAMRTLPKNKNSDFRHLCTSGKGTVNSTEIPINMGWVQFSNGTVLTGMGRPQDKMGNPTPLNPGYSSAIYTLCIDTNAANPPNMPGKDIFFTNFQHRQSGPSFFHAGQLDSNGQLVTSKQTNPNNKNNFPSSILRDNVPGGVGDIKFKQNNGLTGDYLIKWAEEDRSYYTNRALRRLTPVLAISLLLIIIGALYLMKKNQRNQQKEGDKQDDD